MTVTPNQINEILVRAEATAVERLRRITVSDWTRIRIALKAAEQRLPESWQLHERTLDGIVCLHKSGLKVILSGSVEDDGKLWLHLSASRDRLVPNWEQMANIKSLFLGDDALAVQVFPRSRDHINIHRFCLHLWCCLDADPVPDFSSGTGTI